MLIRFIQFCIPLSCALYACDNTSPVTLGVSEMRLESRCPELTLKPSRLSQTNFDRLNRKPSPILIAKPLNTLLASLANAKQTPTAARLALRRAALEFTQQTTLSHFMEYGRLLALSAVNNRDVQTSDAQNAKVGHKTIGRLLSSIVDAPPPPKTIKSREDKMLRYMLYMWSWTQLLSHRIQLGQWWKPWELRWLLEAQVLGHFGLNLDARIKANTALIGAAGYAGAWNNAVLHTWAKRPLSSAMKLTLSASIPMRCMVAHD
jgi:hypothetical protein